MASSAAANRGPVVYTGPIEAKVTFHTPDGIVYFTEMFPESSEDEGDSEGKLNDPDITYRFNLLEMEEEEGHPNSFHVEFMTPEEELLGTMDVTVSGPESNEKTLTLDFIKTDYGRNKGPQKYKGLGARFLAAFESMAKRGGIKKVKLLALEHVKNFYPKYGYTRNSGNVAGRKGYPMSKKISRKKRRTRKHYRKVLI